MIIIPCSRFLTLLNSYAQGILYIKKYKLFYHTYLACETRLVFFLHVGSQCIRETPTLQRKKEINISISVNRKISLNEELERHFNSQQTMTTSTKQGKKEE